MTTRPPESPSQGPFIVPLPVPRADVPRMTDEMRARAIAHIDEVLAHINDPPEEPDWDPRELFPPGRVR